MNLISVRDYKRHAQLRKPWNRSFSPDALQDYRESLITRGNELIECLTKLCRDSKDMFGHADIRVYISRWRFVFELYPSFLYITYLLSLDVSFDFMGDTALVPGFLTAIFAAIS